MRVFKSTWFIVFLVVALFFVGIIYKNAATVPTKTIVWFEDAKTINNQPAENGIVLSDGNYEAILLNDETIDIVVEDGYWYFD